MLLTLNPTRSTAWSPTTFSRKTTQDFLEKRLTAALRQGKYNMNLKHLVLPESKEMLLKGGRGRVNSLAVQWAGLCTFAGRGLGSISWWGTKIPQDAQHSQKKKVASWVEKHRRQSEWTPYGQSWNNLSNKTYNDNTYPWLSDHINI